MLQARAPAPDRSWDQSSTVSDEWIPAGLHLVHQSGHLGHSPPVIAYAISAQARRLITPSPAYYNDTSLKLAKALTDLSAFDRVARRYGWIAVRCNHASGRDRAGL